MWQQPKINWEKNSFFNIEDYNRIKNNINVIRDLALTMWPDFSYVEMGRDKTYQDYGFHAEEINKIEDNLENFCIGIFPFSIGDNRIFYDNQPFIDWQELNRIEEACRLIYSNVQSRINGRKNLSFILGGGVF